MKKYSNFINENADDFEYDLIDRFTIIDKSGKWGNLDQTLSDISKSMLGKTVEFIEYSGKNLSAIKRVEVSEVYFVRYINKKDKKRIGNRWFLIDNKNNTYQISINGPIIVWNKTNKILRELDPYGEEAWEED